MNKFLLLILIGIALLFIACAGKADAKAREGFNYKELKAYSNAQNDKWSSAIKSNDASYTLKY